MKNESMKTLLQRALNAELDGLQTSVVQRERLYRHAIEGNTAQRKTMAGFLLAAVLVMVALTGLAVSFLQGFVFLDQEEHGQLYSCAVKDDCLYVLGNNGLWMYQPGSEQARQVLTRQKMPRYANPLKLELLASEPLMLMDRDTDTLWALEEDGFVVKRSYANTQLAVTEEYGTDFIWQDEMLFVQSDREGCIYRVKLDTCEVERLPIEHVTRLAPYKPGELLALTYSQQQGTVVWVVDAYTGEQRKLCADEGLGIKGVSYSEKEQAIFAIVSGSLSRWDGTVWQTLCGTALPQAPFFLGAFGDHYAAVNHEGVQFIPLDGMDGMEETIVIHGVPDSARYDHGFQQAFPGLTVARRTEAAFDVEDAVRTLTEGTAADLLHVQIAAKEADELWALVEALDSSALREDVKEMMPVLQSLLYAQDELQALPSAIVVEAWKTNGLQGKQPPHTLRELLEDGKYQIGVEAFEGTQEVSIAWEREAYAAYLLKQAIREREAQGLRFTDAAFISTLEALGTWPVPTETATIWYHTAMSLVGYLHGSTGVIPYTLPPVIAEDAQPQIPAYVTVYVLNPNSRNKEAALQYLEYLAANRDSWEEALVKPACAKPVLGEWAQERIAMAPGQRAQIEADPENWEVLAENLIFYREQIAPYIILENLHPKEGAMLQIVLECVNGKMTAVECSRQLEYMVK